MITTSLTGRPVSVSASLASALRISAETDGGVYSLPKNSRRQSRSPISRLISDMTWSGNTPAVSLATRPTTMLSALSKYTTDGVVSWLSLLRVTAGRPVSSM